MYQKTYTRISPYLTGMLAAFYHLKDDGTAHTRSSTILQWLCLIILLFISIKGASLELSLETSPLSDYICCSVAR